MAKINIAYVFFDSSLPTGRQRFTVAHEIGHLILGHVGRGMATVENREPTETERAEEQQANQFAARLLAPAYVLHEIAAITPEAIQELCGISRQAAEFRAERTQELERRNRYYSHPLEQQVLKQFKVCVFTGTLERMQRKDAMQLVVNLGGSCGDSVTAKTNFLILGNNDYCTTIKDGKSTKQKKAEALILKGNDLQIISETTFYDMISEDDPAGVTSTEAAPKKSGRKMDTFGCCSRYEACSDAMKCIHPDPVFASSCQYRQNLLTGRVFYGKNKTTK